MKKIFILATSWEPNYWGTEKEAPYEGLKYTDISDWNDLAKSCPLAGIGIYKKHKEKDYSLTQFMYLIIKGIQYNPETESPYFWVTPIKRSRVTCSRLERDLPEDNQKWFSAIDQTILTGILKDLGERPPELWLNLLKE
ncbi:MAG: hypothetical protein PH343_05660 [Nitrospira sp.]|nr:hypothetical protein [Nitrospira sp.]